MADNKAIKSDATTTLLTAGTKEVTFSGDVIDVQLMELVAVGGTEGARTITEISSETDGLLVNLGANNDVTVTNATAANLKAEVVGTGTFVVQATLAAETTKVIGTVNIAAAQTIAVTQGTAASLNATVVGTGTFATQAAATQSGTWNIGTVSTVTAVTTVSTVTNLSQLGGTAIAMNTGVRSAGTQRVTIATDDTVTVAGNLTNITALGTVTTVTTCATLNGSNLAHDAVDAGNPHKIGLQARTTWPTAVANADRTNAIGDKYGRQLIAHVPRGLRARQRTTITSSTAETTIVTAGAAGVFNDIYKLMIANTSATACNVTIKDSTAGTTVEILAVAAGATVGFVLPACDGVKQTTAANNWTATCSASVASIEITALFVQMVDA